MHSVPAVPQALEFLMDDPGAHTVKLEVVADGSTVLGEASFPLSDVLEAEGLVLRQRVPLDNAAAEGSELLVSLKLYALTPATPEDVPARNFDSGTPGGAVWAFVRKCRRWARGEQRGKEGGW